MQGDTVCIPIRALGLIVPKKDETFACRLSIQSGNDKTAGAPSAEFGPQLIVSAAAIPT